jgi:enediyne biosynthesis protein E4
MLCRLWLPMLAVVLSTGAARGARFADVTDVSGIRFVHGNGAQGDKHLPETMGSGLAFIDADADGQLDLYFVNSVGAAVFYHNKGDGSFADSTAASGLANSGYGMGVVAADVDNDGDQDLYITAYGANLLYRNEGGGRFVDDTQAAGVGDDGFGSGACLADYDNDGDLDLFAANYLRYVPEENPFCARVRGVRVYCGPEAYQPQADLLYRNNGDGTFVDVATLAGLLPTASKELGAVFTDFDDDGDQDLYLAGDKTPNLLYRNDAGTFAEIGVLANVAYGEAGGNLAGMGIAVGDVEGDRRLDYFVTNYQWEANSLYRSLGDGLFFDDGFPAGLAVPSLSKMGWGTSFIDYDRDGDRDLFAVNGHMDDAFEVQDNVSYAQQNQLFRNVAGVFAEITDEAGSGLALQHVSRGSAAADYDNDGDVDLAVSNNGGPGVLLANDAEAAGNWLSVVLQGAAPDNRDAVGARVELLAGGRWQVDEVRHGSSYLSSEDPRLHFGLGTQTAVEVLRIRWPGGAVQELEQVPANQLLVLRQ